MAYETYLLPQGRIMIAYSDEKVSVGTLELQPRKELSKHNRPVLESLFQLKGKCLIKLFNKEGDKEEVVLSEGESLDIEKERFHIHSNPFNEKSLTIWKANGNIIGVLNKIRENSRM